jgi:hypothetical protein
MGGSGGGAVAVVVGGPWLSWALLLLRRNGTSNDAGVKTHTLLSLLASTRPVADSVMMRPLLLLPPPPLPPLPPPLPLRDTAARAAMVPAASSSPVASTMQARLLIASIYWACLCHALI